MPRVAAAVVLVSLLATVATAAVPVPTVEGPVTGGVGSPYIASTVFDLAQVGYEQAEFFMAGTASAFTTATPLTSDGMWSLTPGETAAFRTRVLVYRPTDPKKFKGTVIVEWLNVSAGLDSTPDWIGAHTEMIRSGMAWVGVSAQRVGVEGGTTIIGGPSRPMKEADPARYGSLVHPGDSFSYDIFSQAGQAIRTPEGQSLLGDLVPKKLIAVGESQSAFRLTAYVNGVHPLAGVYDGFLIHSRASGLVQSLGGRLSEAPQPTILPPAPMLIRTDLREPVLIFQTETDVTGVLQYVTDRQPDTKRIRLWEVAGTAHADAYTLGGGFNDIGDSSASAALILSHGLGCDRFVNAGPQHFVLNAAVAALNRWVRRGTPAPRAPRLEASAGPPIVMQRDAHGNALGGIRTPQVDVPIATLSGDGNTGPAFCPIFGMTVPFDAQKLALLYPTRRAFVGAYRKALRRAVARGFIVPRDAALMRDWAAASNVGG